MLVSIGGIAIDCKVARTDSEKEVGLSFVESLDQDSGMVFVWPAPEKVQMWAGGIKIPLDLAFVGEDCRVISIWEDVHPGSVSVYECDGTAYVVEVNAGWFRSKGIRAGDVVEFDCQVAESAECPHGVMFLDAVVRGDVVTVWMNGKEPGDLTCKGAECHARIQAARKLRGVKVGERLTDFRFSAARPRETKFPKGGYSMVYRFKVAS